MLHQAQDMAWRPGSWSASRPNALACNLPSGRCIKRGRRIFFYFSKDPFSALLSVSFDAIERSFDTNISMIHTLYYPWWKPSILRRTIPSTNHFKVGSSLGAGFPSVDMLWIRGCAGIYLYEYFNNTIGSKQGWTRYSTGLDRIS